MASRMVGVGVKGLSWGEVGCAPYLGCWRGLRR